MVCGPYVVDNQSIDEYMRAVLLDWLCSIHHKMKCDSETLDLMVDMIDFYLAKTTASRNKLQLIGTSALLVASKYEQIYPVDINDLVYVCNHQYTQDDVSPNSFLINLSFLWLQKVQVLTTIICLLLE